MANYVYRKTDSRQIRQTFDKMTDSPKHKKIKFEALECILKCYINTY